MWPMSELQGSNLRITSGPRWDALLDALTAASDALSEPLTDEELARGWTEELRVSMLHATDDNLQALKMDPTRAELLIGMVDGDEVGAEDDDERRDATFLPDFAASSLLYAEQVLLATTALLELLRRPLTNDDLAHGMTEETNASLQHLLEEVLETLAAGEYVTDDEHDRWRNLLQDNGFERRQPDGSHTVFGAKVGVGQIDLFPPGRCWEPVCIYDPAFTRLSEIDDER
jgi:hypothetical protein